MEHSFSNFWTKLYKEKRTGWDLGGVSSPIKAYFNQVMNKDVKILFPGCGNAYEAEYLHRNGFRHVYVLDFAEEPLEAFKQRCPDFPSERIIFGDFFTHKASYDIVVEQTFFSAIDPKDRNKYAQKINELLIPGGKLIGLLFNAEFEDGPPFGGSASEYMECFDQYFTNIQMEECYNSVKPRSGRELFIKIQKD